MSEIPCSRPSHESKDEVFHVRKIIYPPTVQDTQVPTMPIMPGLSKCHLDDLLNSPRVPRDNYKRVRYEDLNANPIKIIVDLYGFIGVPVSPEMLEKLKEHFNNENTNGKVNKNYFNTYKTSDFDNTDLSSLPAHVKSEIESECEDVLKILEYSN